MIPLNRSFFDCLKYLNMGPTQRRGFFIIILLMLFYLCTGNSIKDNKFDYLIFTQRWLPASCIEYVEHKSPGSFHYCVLPNNFKVWSIHGLWPTQDKSMGPFFCNKSMAFDIKKINSIESELEMFWPNIEGGKDVASLWQHEWEKHGTCAAQLESLNSEMKYFNTTMSLYKMHNMQILFFKNKILPSEEGISIPYLFQVIKSAIGKMPQIHCIHEVKTNQPYLSEIRLCYNKNLELIDCGNIHSNTYTNKWSSKNGLTNCPDGKNVIFSGDIDPTSDFKSVNEEIENLNYYKMLDEILSFIRFIQWVSI